MDGIWLMLLLPFIGILLSFLTRVKRFSGRDCRPPQSFLEKVVRNQREWFVDRQRVMYEHGYYNGPSHFVVESAIQ